MPRRDNVVLLISSFMQGLGLGFIVGLSVSPVVGALASTLVSAIIIALNFKTKEVISSSKSLSLGLFIFFLAIGSLLGLITRANAYHILDDEMRNRYILSDISNQKSGMGLIKRVTITDEIEGDFCDNLKSSSSNPNHFQEVLLENDLGLCLDSLSYTDIERKVIYKILCGCQ